MFCQSAFRNPHSAIEETRAMTLTQRTHRRRAAFTLIELMVVMAILTLMLTLLMSGVQRVRVAAKRNGAHTEIYQLGQAIAAFKQKFSVDYIPSRIVLKEDGTYNTANQVEADSLNWLKTAWPFLNAQVDWNQSGQIDTGAAGTYTLEGDQCLVFFLGGINEGGQPSGFSTNKRNPMDATTAQRLGPFFQFPVERLSNFRGNGFRSFIDPWKGQPYVYFTSYGKQKGYVATEATLGVAPYIDPATGKGKLIDGFQIICAGEDKLFGPGGPNLPAPVPGEDDIANFSQGTLGSAN
jgi:prepilin-type N-terminal cleavage/methylation domain-containing protein